MKILKFLPVLLLIVAIAGFSRQFNKPTQPRLGRPPQSEHGTVVKVADGDTLTVEMNGAKERIRLCGIDAPEKAQPLGKEAGDRLRQMAMGKQVAVLSSERDRYGRMVGEVFVLGKTQSDPEVFVNSEMVQEGLAYHYAQYSKNCLNREVIMVAEDIAKGKRAGVWANPGSVKPWDYRKN